MIFAGMAILSQQYEWAEKRLEPVKEKALTAAEESVETWPRIVLSVLSGLVVIGVGVVWGLHPPAPSWWPLDEKWWLFGGWGTASTLIISGDDRPQPGGVQLPPVPPGLTSRNAAAPTPQGVGAAGSASAGRSPPGSLPARSDPDPPRDGRSGPPGEETNGTGVGDALSGAI